MKLKNTLLCLVNALVLSQTMYAAIGEDKNTFGPNTLSGTTLYKTGASTYYSSVMLRIGTMACDFTKFNQTTGSDNQFSDMPLFAGLSFSVPLKVRKVGAFDLTADYNFLLPQKHTIGSSAMSRLSGFSAGLGIGTDVFPRNTRFDLIVSAGFQVGRFHLKDSYPGSTLPDYTYNKLFFAPQLSVYPRFVLNAFTIGLRASYHYDVLSPVWTAGQSGIGVPGDATATGYTIEAVFGILLGK
jgi:hypothetical protein